MNQHRGSKLDSLQMMTGDIGMSLLGCCAFGTRVWYANKRFTGGCFELTIHKKEIKAIVFTQMLSVISKDWTLIIKTKRSRKIFAINKTTMENICRTDPQLQFIVEYICIFIS